MENDTVQVVRRRDGVAYTVERTRMAIEDFPPPDDLPDDQQDLWRDALERLPAAQFGRRNFTTLREYCRIGAILGTLDPLEDLRRYRQVLALFTRLSHLLCLSVPQERTRQQAMRMERLKLQAEEKAQSVKAAREKSAPTNPTPADIRKALMSGGRPQ